MNHGKVVILGLGNPVLTDDAVGLRVIDRLEELLAADPVQGLDVLASTRAGFELLDILTGYRHAMIVDAFLSDKPDPGKVRWLTIEDITGNARLINAHEISIDVAFDLAEKLNVPMPEHVDIVAIEAEDIYTLCEEMTPALQAVVDPVARDIFGKAKELVSKYSPDEKTDGENDSPKRSPYYSP